VAKNMKFVQTKENLKNIGFIAIK